MNNSLTLSTNMSLLEECLRETTTSLIDQLVSLVRMEVTSTEVKPNDGNKYEITFIPVIVISLIIEQIIRLIKRQDLCRYQDFIINLGASLIFVLFRSLIISFIVFTLYWIYENYSLIQLPLDSIWTWILALLMGELSVYCTHRAMHEINFLWAAHHFHHMTEDLNVSATIRATILDLFLYDLFPMPLALFIPPQLLVYHIQLSFLYQMWLHNEVVGNLGPIEYIINTPRQHRVHHGKNRYCIDKNYGTFLMVWDRLFGTYQSYQEKPIFGLVSQTPQTYDTMTLQFGYYWEMIQKLCKIQGLSNKASILFKGPGWAPGKPRLGNIDDVPNCDINAPKYSYDPHISQWKKIYSLIHISIITLAFMQLADYSTISNIKILIGVIYITIFLTSIGALFDRELPHILNL
ncbi:alkylglycerol monooxygenase-like [Oppia nitens]|uniref:alkylglycerol monooxygenase-like n=1 Tax=Oppia nitens TaxID=1686743 RepID=UPI0023DBFF1A|nr:alkylglycerol monooxygenase-like [Oppia nitens]